MQEAVSCFFMKTTNMGGGLRTCVLLVIFVNLQLIDGKPFFGTMFCAMFCDDDDYDDPSLPTTTTTLEDLIDAYFDICSECTTSRPTTPRTPTPNPMQPFNFMIPPSANGMNVTWVNTGSSYAMQVMPWTAGTTGSTTAATTTAGTTAATTAAADAATNATTAAPTTAAA